MTKIEVIFILLDIEFAAIHQLNGPRPEEVQIIIHSSFIIALEEKIFQAVSRHSPLDTHLPKRA